jgi:hypothetical protein
LKGPPNPSYRERYGSNHFVSRSLHSSEFAERHRIPSPGPSLWAWLAGKDRMTAVGGWSTAPTHHSIRLQWGIKPSCICHLFAFEFPARVLSLCTLESRITMFHSSALLTFIFSALTLESLASPVIRDAPRMNLAFTTRFNGTSIVAADRARANALKSGSLARLLTRDDSISVINSGVRVE